ncbi:MAG: phosphate acyltransferase PlsX [Clostridia bacterium]|nr:phosphate acyltransferase PlsX [Clostridia bacterium]
MTKIVVDVFSGDNPEELIKGVALTVNETKDVYIILPGNPEYLEKELSKHEFDRARVEILPASEIIENNESPTEAIRKKKDSSLVRGMTALKNDPEIGGIISAGSTGAILCGGIFIVGRIRGIDRPALGALLPTATGGNVCLVDCGANSECRPQYLAQFALLGTATMRGVCGVENPKVALVNVGQEDHKGNAFTHESAELIREMPVNFVGNMEARDTLSGKYDVLVCDGFTGNVVLKSIEGTAKLFATKLMESAKVIAQTDGEKLAVKNSMMSVMGMLDYNSKGGAWLLGCNKPILKIHGAATAQTVPNAVALMCNMITANMADEVSRVLQDLTQR